MYRRDFLKAATLTSAGLMIPTSSVSLQAKEKGDRLSRFVHLTDIHVQPERNGDQGMTKCLQAIEKLDPKPDFILTGGDLIYDAGGDDGERGQQLFELYKKVIAEHTSLPVYHCVGNHDVFGWSKKKEVQTDNPLFGKGMMQKALGLEKTYYAFEHNGWRFYVLDSIQPTEDKPYSYTAGLDTEQLEWLKADLAAKPSEQPAVVVTHIPVLTVSSLRKQPKMLGDDFYLAGGPGMFSSSLEMGQLFHKHNVRLALSGHLHEIDRIKRGNVTYICDGAVCGGWWYGPNVDSGFEVQEGFGLVDLYAEGRFEHHYVDYGWETNVKQKGE